MKNLTRKKLIILRGPMGIGKTTVGEALLKQLPAAAYLDGDWCWRMHPFVVDDLNKEMVLDNIVYLLRGFLHNPNFRYVIFSWVIQEDGILREILRGLEEMTFELRCYKLVASPDKLLTRLERAVAAGEREPDTIERSLRYLPLYEHLVGTAIDVGEMNVEETVQFIKWDLL